MPSDWTRIELVRKGVGFFLWASYGRGDLRDSLSMVSAELLENAMKYAPPTEPITFALYEEGDRLVVTVKNAVDVSSHHVASLRERLAWIEGFPTASEAYMAALAEVFHHKEGQGEGGLGMVRIAYEGGCELSCDTPEPGVLVVRASRPLQQAASTA